ncbi:hypothetical protein M758_2G011700 [Ceratodon purpureus]|nr:hypothetical protein M758_2G011700 [Ceratodon purpureus]KAG0624887.1 hypothetical protein M758_2G011700 [Ceratodon purpureus]KAG0624890.1 hypothetical protein M758_2G011700 [Ceratodon purpureus]
MTCKKVITNGYCPQCDSKNFDFTRSYVRQSNSTDTTSKDTAAIICSQRGLDAAFKSVCNETSHSRAFLGTVDGTYIHFPGSDRSKDECTAYDPRIRPWYRASTSLQKAVMVLVDGGALGSRLRTPLSGVFLTLTKDIVADLLNTLSENDVVNVITYNNSNATPLASQPKQVQYNLSSTDSTYHPEFSELLDNLSSSNKDNGGGSSNISFGITKALDNFKNYDTYMKIIIVFTVGSNINSQGNGSLAALVGKNVKVFVFKLPLYDDTSTPTEGFFLKELRSVGGSYNVLTSTEVKNRLLSIVPYFSFLAKYRASLNDSADYGPVYEDFEHNVDKVFPITKPVFANDGRLLGVVGLNIFLDELPGNKSKSVNDALAGRNGGKAFDPSKFALTAANASIYNDTYPTLCEDGVSSMPSPSEPDQVLCAQNYTRSIQDLACCGTCEGNSKLKHILLGVGIPVTVAIVALLIYFLYRHWKKGREPEDKYVWKGGGNAPKPEGAADPLAHNMTGDTSVEEGDHPKPEEVVGDDHLAHNR